MEQSKRIKEIYGKSLDVPCPHCHVPPGEQCIKERRKESKPHARRWKVVRDQQKNAHPPYRGELRSGDFGPNSGHYHVYIEFYGIMTQHNDRDTGIACFSTREVGWAAQRLPGGGSRSGHAAVVGVTDCDKMIDISSYEQ